MPESIATVDDATAPTVAPAERRPPGRAARLVRSLRKTLTSWWLLEHVNHMLHQQNEVLTTLSRRLDAMSADVEGRHAEVLARTTCLRCSAISICT